MGFGLSLVSCYSTDFEEYSIYIASLNYNVDIYKTRLDNGTKCELQINKFGSINIANPT